MTGAASRMPFALRAGFTASGLHRGEWIWILSGSVLGLAR
jgi:hypothetical protein